MAASYQTTIKGNLDGVPVQNSIYFATLETDNNFTTAVDINTQLAGTGIIDDYLDCLPTAYIADAVETRGIVTQGGGLTSTPAAILDLGGAPGTRTGDVQSNQAGPIASYFPGTTSGERARVNKIFFPGLSEDDASADFVDGTLITAISTFVNTLLAGFTANGNATSWKALIKTAGLKTIRNIIAVHVEEFVASQRRRRPPTN